jgi:hypothetical protein
MPFDCDPETKQPSLSPMVDGLLQFFGPTGDNWIRGNYRDHRGRACLLGAVIITTDSRDSPALLQHRLTTILYQAVVEVTQYRSPSPMMMLDVIVNFNDGATDFSKIQRLLQVAALFEAGHMEPKYPCPTLPTPGFNTLAKYSEFHFLWQYVVNKTVPAASVHVTEEVDA